MSPAPPRVPRRAAAPRRAPSNVGLLWVACLVGTLLALLAPPRAAGAVTAPDQPPEASSAAASAAPASSQAPGAAAIDPSVLVHGLAPLPGGAPVPLEHRPPGAFEGDGGPSPVIFPAQQLTVRFNHKKHVQELGLTCTSCHEKARTSRKSQDSLLPPPTRCDACHGTDHRELTAVKPDPTELIGQCAFCHLGWKEGDGNRVARLSIPPPNLRFDHRKHLARNIDCAQCHGAVQEVELATRDQLPRMRGCFGCHQAPPPAQGDAHGACTTCHLKGPGGLVRTSYPEGQLLPPRWLHDAGHGPDWIERHKLSAGTDSQLCATCHSERYCTDCHDGKVRNRRVHPGDWISTHPVAARMADPTCTSCHRQQTFCLGCHQRAGVTMSGPSAAFDGRGRFHPPASVWNGERRGPGHHAWEAQRNLNPCVSCHVERDCTSCHATEARGSRGTGLGYGGQSTNPHPAGFASSCGSALRRNARPCLVCHDPTDPKLAECRSR